MSASLYRLAEDLLQEHAADLRWAAAELCAGRPADAQALLEDAAIVIFHQVHDLHEIDDARSWMLSVLVRTHRDGRRADEGLALHLAHRGTLSNGR